LAVSHKVAHAAAQDLGKQQQAQQQVIKQLQGRLANKSYVDHAPKSIVEQTQAQLAEAEQLLTAITAEYGRFKNL
jgi:valyl-tRNA synthetase